MTEVPRFTIVIFTCLLLQAGMAHGASSDGLSREQTQQMLEDAQKMQKCFENIDQDALEKLAGEGRRAEMEIRSLLTCEFLSPMMSRLIIHPWPGFRSNFGG